MADKLSVNGGDGGGIGTAGGENGTIWISFTPPQANIITPDNPISGTHPLTVQFEGEGIAMQGRTISLYRWDFGDGSEVSYEQNPVHTFDNNGTYTVSLVVVDDTGMESTPDTVIVTACFIATAAYGTPFAEEINVLRDFRDNHLMKNAIGRKFCDFYYKTSPPVAQFISDKTVLRAGVRAILKPIVWAVKKL